MNQIVEEWVNSLDAALKEEWEERAAIIEFDGGLPREHAECLALLCIVKKYSLALSGEARKEGDLI